MDRPPNILVVLSDEHTAAAGWAGHPHVLTPHLDRLAAQGVSFDRAYTNAAVDFLRAPGEDPFLLYGGEHAPQVFNLDDDPLELYDLSGDPALVRRLDAEVRLVLDPDATGARAKSDQAARMAASTAPRG